VDYEVFPGWNSDLSSIRSYEELPVAARWYVERIEELVGAPIHYIGMDQVMMPLYTTNL